MRRSRKWLLTAATALALLLPLASVASADPNDGGFSPSSTIGTTWRGGGTTYYTTTAALDPNDGGFGP